MAKRVRHPMVSFAMFLVVCSMGWVMWENRDWLKSDRQDMILDGHVREQIEQRVYDTLEPDVCFSGLRGHLNWRPNEHRYRLDIELEDGESCEQSARTLCRKIAVLIQEETGVVATVVAFDEAGRELGRCVL